MYCKNVKTENSNNPHAARRAEARPNKKEVEAGSKMGWENRFVKCARSQKQIKILSTTASTAAVYLPEISTGHHSY